MSYATTALEQLESSQLDEFKKSYALALRHDDDDTLYNLAAELYPLGFLNQAKRIYEKLLDKYPEEDDLRVNLAEILIGEDQTDEALTYLNAVQPDSDAYVQALMVTADLYQTQELFEVSEQKLLEAQSLMPDEDVITFALAELYFTMREFNKAIGLYMSLIRQGVTTLSAVNIVERVGVAYANAGRFEQAIGYLEQIHTGSMTPNVKFETGFTYLQLKDYKNAIKLLQDLRETDHDYSSLYLPLGQALEADNQLDEAMTVLQEGLSVDQYNESLFGEAARVATKLDDEATAETYLKQGNEIEPDDLSLVISLSNLFVKQERWQETIDFLSDYISSDDVDPQIYWNLAQAYVATEQDELALRYYQLAAPALNDDPDFLKPAIYFFREMGERTTALTMLRHYVELVPDDEEMALLLEDDDTE